MKRYFTIQDRRQYKDDRCDRVEIIYRVARQFSFNNLHSCKKMINDLDEGKVDDKYVVQRIREIASTPPPYDNWDDYIETGAIFDLESGPSQEKKD